MRYLGVMTNDTGRVRGEGTVVRVGGRVAAAEGRLYEVGNDERTLDHATTGCLVMRP